jgi:hypothetical protein
MYADFFCSQYIESVVSPIFADNNNNNEKERKTIQGTIKLSKGRVSEKKKLMIIVISPSRTLLS